MISQLELPRIRHTGSHQGLSAFRDRLIFGMTLIGAAGGIGQRCCAVVFGIAFCPNLPELIAAQAQSAYYVKRDPGQGRGWRDDGAK